MEHTARFLPNRPIGIRQENPCWFRLDLSSQPTMTRLENNISSKTLYRIGKLFLDEYISSFDKAPKKIIVDADDTNANTYGAQQLTLFNAYYNEYCYMPLLLFDVKAAEPSGAA